jgi:subtilisin family serine protease
VTTRTWRAVACAAGLLLGVSSVSPALAETPGSPELEALPAVLDADLTLAEEQTLAEATSGAGVPFAAFVETPDGPEIVTLDAGSRSDAAAAASLLEAQPSVDAANVSTMARPADSARAADLYGTAMVRSEAARADVDNPLSDVVVAVLDTGVATHPELASALLPGRNFTDSPGGVLDTTDRHGHGTHVAGTIAADAGSDIEGVAHGVALLPVKVLGDAGPGWDSWIADGIVWAADNGADVINMSLSGPGYSAVEESAVAYARSQGVTVIAAAGNDNSSALYSPAGLAGVISVSAVDEAQAKASFSNFGTAVDLAAPGVLILSAAHSGGLTYKSGTSMAAPHVAGVAALVVGAAPGLTPAQVEQALVAGAIDRGTAGRDDVYGHGLVDATRAVGAANSLEGTGSVSLPPVVVSAPDAPAALSSTVSSRRVDLAWGAPADDGYSPVTGYTVRIYDGGTLLASNNAPATVRRQAFTGLTNGRAYTATVVATNAQGAGPSASVSATPYGTPGWPVIGTATPGNGSVVLGWNAPSDDGGSPVTGYTLLVHQGPTLLRTLSAGAADRTLTVTGLSNGTAYTFLLSATNAVGQGTTNQVTVTPRTTPGAPVIGTPTPAPNSVVVAWTPPADNGGAAISGYTVRAYLDGVLVNSAVAPSTATSLPVTLAQRVPHTFTVTAHNAVGPGTPSADSAPVTPGAPLAAPSAPVMGTPDLGSTAVRVKWTAPASDGGSPVTGYTVRVYRAGVLLTAVDTAATEYVFRSLANGTEYSFTVVARNAIGAGPGAATTATPRTVPSGPRIGTPTAGAGVATVRWAAPAINGGAPVTGYTVRVYRGTTHVQTLSAGASATSLGVTGLANGHAHTFVVWATNAAGTGAASARSVAVVPRTVASPPRITAVGAGRGTVGVAWARPYNGGAAITSYVVRFYAGSALARKVTVPATATSYLATRMTPGVRYTVTVSAMNVAGASPMSAPSAGVVPRR